jgi:hypothetical protein
MTIGLAWRRTARRIKRLKEGILTILQITRIARPPTFWRSRFKYSATTAVGFCPLGPVGPELCLELGNRSGSAYCYCNWGLLARG